MEDVTAAVELLLNISRENISNGNGDEALAALVHAITLSHPRGENAVADILDQAKKRAEAESEEQLRQNAMVNLEKAKEISRRLLEENTILSESGMQTILKDAFEDGSSLVCGKCGSLVPTSRAEAHSRFWCDYATESSLDDDNSL